MRLRRFSVAVCLTAAAILSLPFVVAHGQKKTKTAGKTKTAKTETKKDAKKDAKPKKIEVEFVVSNLENPSGIAIQPKTGHVFVASRYGIYRYDPADHKVYLEIDTYPTDTYGKGTYETHTKFDVGPLGLAFMDDDHLVVGDGSRKDAAELVRVYKMSAKPAAPEKYIDEDKAAHTLGPIKAGEKSAKGEGNFYGVAVGNGAIYVTCNGDDTKGWVSKSVIKDGKPGKLEPTIATKVATGVDAPVPITFSPEGKLVIGQMGEMNKPGDSLLTIYDAKTGKLEKKYETGLSDIAGLAYSPKTKKLYATDFGWADPTVKEKDKKRGGLYELVIEGDKVTAKKIVALDHPAAIAFDKDGKLYVTQFGSKDPKDKTDRSAGGLYVIDAGL